MKRLIDASLILFPLDTQLLALWVFACFFCNVGVWILQSEAEFTRIQPGTSLCFHSLFGSRMQRAAGLDRGWGKWAECI